MVGVRWGRDRGVVGERGEGADGGLHEREAEI